MYIVLSIKMPLSRVKRNDFMQNSVNYEMLSECANELKKIAIDMQYITDQISEVANGVEKNGFWSGKGADYFQQQFNRFKKYFDESYNQVMNYSIALDNTILKYKMIDESISKMIG